MLFQNLNWQCRTNDLPDINREALPTKLFRHGFTQQRTTPIFGKAKVREFDNWKNFENGFFCLFSASCA
jgi:hypothetical protein